MSDEKPQPDPEIPPASELAAAEQVPAEAAPEPAEPPPEPLTPERMQQENRQGDRAIAALVALLAVAVASFKVVESDIWIRLKTGWLVHHEGVPRTDSFSYATEGTTWRNPAWLFDWGLYQLESIETRFRARRLANRVDELIHPRPQDEAEDSSDVLATTVPADLQKEIESGIATLREKAASEPDTTEIRWAADDLLRSVARTRLHMPQAGDEPGALLNLAPAVALKSLVVLLMALVLLQVRQPGPTLWWTSICVVLALLGMGDRLGLRPEVISYLLMACVLWVSHVATTRWPQVVWALVPIHLLWANVDTLFPVGLGLSGLYLLGDYWRRIGASYDGRREMGVAPVTGALAWGASLLATFLNPYGPVVWSVPLGWTVQLTTLQHLSGGPGSAYSRVGAGLRSLIDPTLLGSWQGFRQNLDVPILAYLLLLAGAIGSFFVARERRGLSRLFVLLFAVLLSVVVSRHTAIAAMVCAVVLALNGQEWSLGRFGGDARITRGWMVWSRGARAATVLVVLVVSVLVMTGRAAGVGAARFGWGMEWFAYDYGATRFLRQAHLQGRALHTTTQQGALQLWANCSLKQRQQVFQDTRLNLHVSRREQINALFQQLSQDKRAEWQPTLDQWGISHVLLNMHMLGGSPTFLNTYKAMRKNEQWKLLYVGHTVVIFGRVDGAAQKQFAGDARYFAEHEFRESALAFQKGDSPPPPLDILGPPPIKPPGYADRFWRLRQTLPRDGLSGVYLTDPFLLDGFPHPENAYVAIRAGRRGVANAPTSSLSYDILRRAYGALLQFEMQQAGEATGGDSLRVVQVMAAMNQLVAADPNNLVGLLDLGSLYEQHQYYDLAADLYERALRMIPDDFGGPAPPPPAAPAQGTGATATGDPSVAAAAATPPAQPGSGFDRMQLEQLVDNIRVAEENIRARLDEVANQAPSPLDQAQYCLRQGFPKLAVERLTSPYAAAPGSPPTTGMLVDIYLQTGQVGEAYDVMSEMPADPTPGLFEHKWGMLHLLRGDYDRAKRYWEVSLAKLRHSMGERMGTTFRDWVHGAPLQAAGTFTRLAADIERQALIEYHLGILELEIGNPTEAARHLEHCVDVSPTTPHRPLVSYYVERINGKKIPPKLDTPESEKPSAKPGAKPGQPARKTPGPPANPQPGAKRVPPDKTEPPGKPADKAPPNQEPAAKAEPETKPADKTSPPDKKSATKPHDKAGPPDQKSAEKDEPPTKPAEKATPNK